MMLGCGTTGRKGDVDRCWKYLDAEDYWNIKICHCVENVVTTYYLQFKTSAIRCFVLICLDA